MMTQMTNTDEPRPKRPWLKLALPAMIMFVIGVGAFATRDIWRWYFVSGNVTYQAPVAQALTVDTADQTVYRINPTRSSASYTVQEHLAGVNRTATGTSSAIAGDIRVDSADPSKSTVGEIVVNVELFKSDNSLRDKRIRHDYLESGTYKFVNFMPTEIAGLPDSIVDGQSYDITIAGDLKVKTTTAAATFSGTASISGGELTSHMSATVLSSTFDVGPITISGLVSTSDEVTLTFDFVAVDIANGAPPAVPTALDQQVLFDPNSPGDFAASVMPILAGNCASCHNAGGVGASTWALDSAGDAAQVAEGIAVVTGSAYMPPWPASDLSVAFHDSWKLSQSELDTLAGWSASGGAIDVPADTPIVAPASSINSIEHDVEMTASAPYAGTEQTLDDYRCQIFDPQFTSPSWIVGMEFTPDQVSVVHHSVDYHASASTRAAAEAADAADPGAGWTCYGLTGIGGRNDQPEQIMAWAPGQQPEVLSPGTGILFQPGDFVIAQIHRHYEHKFPLDQSQLSFDVASPEQLAAAGGELAPISHHVLIAPAEIPCTPDQSGPMCDRDNVLARLAREFGDSSGPDQILKNCGKTLAETAVLVDGVARGSCDTQVPGAAEIVSVFGHMHEFGETFRMTLNPGRPDEQILLDIPNWSFDWQFNFELETPVSIKKGDLVRIECSWNRALVQQTEPAYVTWSDGTKDEMCYSVVAVRPPEH